jgi:hypothetical protein
MTTSDQMESGAEIDPMPVGGVVMALPVDAADSPEIDESDKPERPKVAIPTKRPEVKRPDVKRSAEDREVSGGARPDTKAISDIRASEDQSLKAMLDGLGAVGGFKIKLSRKEPTEWPDSETRRMVQVGGHLYDYYESMDESDIQKKHGGGKYELKIFRKNAKGSFEFFTQRTIQIAGDPRTDDVHRSPVPVRDTTPARETTQEAPSVVNKVMDVMERQLEAARSGAAPKHDTAPYELMIKALNDQLARQQDEMRQMRQELAVARNVKPEPDPIKDKLLGSLIDGESGRITSLRLQHESETNQLRQSMRDLEDRLRDRADRDLATARAAHEREIAMIRMSHESAITAIRSAADSTGVATKSAADTSQKLLESDIKRLEKENDRLQDELKELRGRKDKTVIEQLKDMKAIKDAFGIEDDDKDESAVDKIIGVLSDPAAVQAARDIIRGPQAPVAPPPQAPRKIARAPGKPRTVRNKQTGEIFHVGDNGELVPVAQEQPAAPAQPQLPQVSAEEAAQILGYMERAFEGSQEPEVFAQTAKAALAGREEIFTALRELGVDGFLSKVAKLPSSSSLATQAGRNWTRKLGKALVGE